MDLMSLISNEYVVGGIVALFTALGGVINHIWSRFKFARELAKQTEASIAIAESKKAQAVSQQKRKIKSELANEESTKIDRTNADSPFRSVRKRFGSTKRNQ